MSDDDLFSQLIKIGIDEKVAHQVAASLSPDHIATKSDILRLERLILDVQTRTSEQFSAMQIKTAEQFCIMQTKTSEQFNAHNRQFWITFGGLILSACVLFAMNLYFH